MGEPSGYQSQPLNTDGWNHDLHQQLHTSPFLSSQPSQAPPQQHPQQTQSLNTHFQSNTTDSYGHSNMQNHNNIIQNVREKRKGIGKERNENDMIGGLLSFLDSNEKIESKLPLSVSTPFCQPQQKPSTSIAINLERNNLPSQVINRKKNSMDFEEDDLFAAMENERKRMLTQLLFDNSN